MSERLSFRWRPPGLSIRAAARRMGLSSPSVVQRVERADQNLTVATLERYAWACGGTVEIRFVPKPETLCAGVVTGWAGPASAPGVLELGA